MHRLLLLSVLAAIAVFAPSLQAQRGRAASAPVRGAPHSAAAARPATGGVRAGGRFVPGRFGRTFYVSPRFRYRHRFFVVSGCFGYPYSCSGFYYPYSALYYPPYFWPETEYPQQPYPVVQQAYDDTALRAEVDRLADEVERLREEQAHPAPSASRPAAEQVPPTVLVFRDGHRSEVQNYGIVGQTLWVFTERHARKYPLSDLDLSATKAANEQRGIEFVVPVPPQPEKPMSPTTPSPIPHETTKEASIRR